MSGRAAERVGTTIGTAKHVAQTWWCECCGRCGGRVNRKLTPDCSELRLNENSSSERRLEEPGFEGVGPRVEGQKRSFCPGGSERGDASSPWVLSTGDAIGFKG